MKNIFFHFKTLTFTALALLLALTSCIEKTDPENLAFDKGVYLLHEGNFNWQNGSLSFYDVQDSSLYRDAFTAANLQTLGDVPQHIAIWNNTLYIVVNNSGRIEICDKGSIKRLARVEGLTSPRYLVPISDNAAIISDLYANHLYVLGRNAAAIDQYIPAPATTEALLKVGQKLYVSHWHKGAKVSVLDMNTWLWTDSIFTAPEPSDLATDTQNRLWVLCGGGLGIQARPALQAFSLYDHSLQLSHELSTADFAPSRMRMNARRDTIFYIHRHVYFLNLNDPLAAPQILIPAENRKFYGLNISPEGDLWLSDAKDFVGRSTVFVYKPNGILKFQFEAGTNTSYFLFHY